MKNLKIKLSVVFICNFCFANAQVFTTLAGSDAGNWGYSNGTGTGATFHYPYGVAADASGNLYIADYNNNAIRKIVIATAMVTTFAGINTPYGVTVDGGNLYVANYSNNTILQIVIATGIV